MKNRKRMIQEILDALRLFPDNLAGIVNRTGLSVESALSLLEDLEKEGMVRSFDDGRYEMLSEHTMSECD